MCISWKFLQTNPNFLIVLRDFRICFSVREGLVLKEKQYLIEFDTRSSTSSNSTLQSIVLQSFQVAFPALTVNMRMIAIRELSALSDRTLWDYTFVKNLMGILLMISVMIQIIDVLWSFNEIQRRFLRTLDSDAVQF
jgi:hypothetical protein